MKPVLLLFALLTFGFAGNASTISGSVIHWGAGTINVPAYNKTVYIVDSTSTHYKVDSVRTDYDGSFSYTVPGSFTGGMLRIYTADVVNSPSSMQVTYSGASISGVNLFVSFRKYAVWGKTTLGGAPNTGPTKLYLILIAYDAVLMDTVLTAIDSFTTIGSTGNFYRVCDSSAYSLTSGGTHSLLVKAALMPGHASYASYLPAYSYSSLNWSGAGRIDSCEIPYRFGSNFERANIDLPGGTNTGGPGFIGGSVLVGANKSTAVGDPISKRILLLTTAAGKAVGFTYSDAQGKFSFSNLPIGSYLIFGDAWGKSNPPLAVTISSASPAVRNIIFEENNKEFKGHFNTLAVEAPSGLASVTLSPNPASSHVVLQGLSGIDGDKQIVLCDIRGLTLRSTRVKAGSDASLATSELPAGLYLLQVQTTKGVANYRFVKQ